MSNTKELFKADLHKCVTLDDFFEVCKKHYNTEGTKLGIGAKAALIMNVDKIIMVTGAKPRK